MKSLTKYYQIAPKDNYIIKSIIETYDGIALMSCVNAKQGIVIFHIAPGCEDVIFNLINKLSGKYSIKDHEM